MYTEEILCKESRMKIVTNRPELVKEAYEELVRQRNLLEGYIKKNGAFEGALVPVDVEPNSPEIVKKMCEAGKIANVGPMAAVAGTIAEYVCRNIISNGAKVAVVENGGDIFAITSMPISVGLFVGKNSVSGKLAFKLDKENTPIAICSSSSKMGHSKSFGNCDLATVFAKKGAIADACATALCNKVKEEGDINPALKWIISLEGVDGALVIKNDKIGAIGSIPPMIKSDDDKIRNKVTKSEGWEI